MSSARALALAIAVLAALPAAAPAALRAGAAKADITPANGDTTLGYVRPDIPVVGVHTRLTGRVLVLDDGDTRVALLSTDLAFPHQKDSLVARVKDLGYSHATILYTGTHTHSGPGDLADWQVEQLARAIREATARLRPARAAWADASVSGVNRNRSIEAHLANHGIEQLYGQGHPEDDPGGAAHTLDERLRVLRVDGTDGAPIAAWLTFPVHLTTSTPAVDVWDSDIAAPAEHHLERAVGGGDFVTLYSNGSLGDLMPRFDAYNPTALMDLHGLRIAEQAWRAWRSVRPRLRSTLPVDVRWTRACYCGQEVEPTRRVSSEPVWGLAFFGGSEDGASIFHEPLATEGRRLPPEAADPVHGRKIRVAPGLVHEGIPEIQAVRVGDRVLLAAPGEPSVEMGRRFEAAVQPFLPRGVREGFVVSLANDYIGYMTTPEEYEMQHYEGGHTVFGIWTSLLVRNSFVSLTKALATGEPAPPPDAPAALGATGAGSPIGNGGVSGAISEQPAKEVERMGTVELAWSGADGGVDRPVDRPFVTLERSERGGWRRVDSDLGLSFVWREAGGGYRVRYDLLPSLPAGVHRLRVTSGGYDLASESFEVRPADDLRLRGVLVRALRRGRARLTVLAQNPPPDPERHLRWRPQSPNGGTALLRAGGTPVTARWSWKAGGWVATVRRRVRAGAPVLVRRLADRWGNRIPAAATVRAGDVAPVEWPPNMGVGGGRTPGPFGEGEFPP